VPERGTDRLTRGGGCDDPYTGAVVDPAVHLGGPLGLGSRAVLVPVKSFAEAKHRLHAALSDTERAALARATADRVLAAALPLPVAVVCDDRLVAGWARARGALVVWEPGRGLNGAVEDGVARLRTAGVTQVTVAHSDLPRAVDLPLVGEFAGITLVPDRYGNGTNVIALPTDCGFEFSYGPGSFARHRSEAARIGLPTRVLDRPDLAWDIDEPADVVPVRAAAPPER
jgi:2-phospho-L-lactate/phosphoenolpyruvate guanylyltransferase